MTCVDALVQMRLLAEEKARHRMERIGEDVLGSIPDSWMDPKSFDLLDIENGLHYNDYQGGCHDVQMSHLMSEIQPNKLTLFGNCNLLKICKKAKSITTVRYSCGLYLLQ